MAMFDLVVANATAPRDGRFIEKIGTYNPNTIPASIVLNDDKALGWLLNGAQPTDTVRAILSYRGVMYKKHLQIGVIKGAISQEEADAKFESWKTTKDSKISGRVDNLAQAKADAAKARMEAETKVNAARVAAQASKLAAAIAAANPEPVVAEAPAVEEVIVEAPAAVEEVVAEAPAVAEAPVAEEVVAEASAVFESPAAEEVVAEAPAAVESPAVEEVVAEAPVAEEVVATSASDEETKSAE